MFTRRLIFKEKLLPFCCVNYVFNFLLYHTSKIQHPTSKIWYECIRIFEYFPIRIFVRIIFVSFVWYEYIRIFVRIIFLIQIYSDIRSYHFFDTNIFGYSFLSFFGYRYIRIFIRIKNSYSPHPCNKVPGMRFFSFFVSTKFLTLTF